MTVTVSDSTSTPYTEDFTITVDNVNDAPSFANTLDGNPTFTEDGMPVVLDMDVAIFDPELSALSGGNDDFGDTTLTIQRSGGANSDDVFSAGGMLSFGATDFSLAGITVGTFTNSAGRIELTFDACLLYTSPSPRDS